jgi:hypothetical protein
MNNRPSNREKISQTWCAILSKEFEKMYLIAYVLVPSGTEDIDQYIEKVMAHYHNEWEVEEYEKECDCVWRNAWTKAQEAIQKELGSSETGGFPWDKRVQRAQQIRDRESRRSLVDPDCDECGGKEGVYMTTFNPNAMFDSVRVNHGIDTFHKAAKDPSKVSSGQAIVPVKDVDLERLEAPDSIVTLSGEWHDAVVYENAESGIVEKEKEDWKDQVKGVLEEHMDETLVEVLYHQ